MDRKCLLTVVVAAMLLFAGVPATAAASAPTPQAQAAQQVQQVDETSVEIPHLVVENLSTDMTLESATMVVQEGPRSRRIAVDSAEVELTNATVEVSNAAVENGTLSVEEANVSITEGTVSIDSNVIDRTIDLSETNATYRDRSISLSDLGEGEMPQLQQMLRDGTIRRMTVSGISGTAEVDDVGALIRPSDDGNRSVTMALVDSSVDIEGASMTLTDATIEEGDAPGEADTLLVGEMTVRVDSAEMTTDRFVLLRDSTAMERTDTSVTFEDLEVTHEDVEITTMSDLRELLSETMDQLSGQLEDEG